MSAPRPSVVVSLLLSLGAAGRAPAQELPVGVEAEGEATEGEATEGEAAEGEAAGGEAAETEEVVPPSFELEDAVERAIQARRAELSDGSYEFCHEEDFDADELSERRFCRVWEGSAREVCPQASKLCVRSESWWDKLSLSLPPWLGWLLIGLLAAAAVLAFARSIYRARRERGAADLSEVLIDEDALADDIQHLPEAPALTILRRARATFEEGQVREAGLLLQLAALRYLDDTGLVQFHASRTNGEYLRAIRRYSELWAFYRRIAHVTDRARFGDGIAESGEVSALLERAAALLAAPPVELDSAAPAASSLVLVIVMVLAGSLSAGCDGAGRPYYSHRPLGMAALPGLLREMGLEVEIGRYEIAEVPADVGVVVLRGAAALGDVKDLGLDALLDRDLAVVVIDVGTTASLFLPLTSTLTSTGAVLDLLNPSWQQPPPAEHAPGEDLFCGIDLAAIGELLDGDPVRLPRAADLRWDGKTSTTSGSKHTIELSPLLGASFGEDGTVRAAGFGGVRYEEVDDGEASRYLRGCTLVLRDELFTNASLAISGNAAFVGAIFGTLTRQGQRILLLESVDKGGGGIARSVSQSRLLPLILQGGLWVALLFLFLGAAFGPLRDPVRSEHKAFVEHVEAIGRHYARAGLGGLTHAARSLARLVVLRHRHEARGGAEAGWLAIARHLAGKHGLEERDVEAALRLGLEGLGQLGPPAAEDPAPASERMLHTLSTLLSSRRQQKDNARRRRARR